MQVKETQQENVQEETMLNLTLFLKTLLTRKVLGYVLDLARVSEMGERQFKQFERSVKNYVYEVLGDANTHLCQASKFETIKNIVFKEEGQQNDNKIGS
jgi:hypothetical protein